MIYIYNYLIGNICFMQCQIPKNSPEQFSHILEKFKNHLRCAKNCYLLNIVHNDFVLPRVTCCSKSYCSTDYITLINTNHIIQTNIMLLLFDIFSFPPGFFLYYYYY